MSNIVVLTTAQENQIIDIWNKDKDNPPDLKTITQLIFPGNPALDGRSFEAKAIKAFIAAQGKKVRTASVYVPLPPKEISEDQKRFIIENINKLAPLELVRECFGDWRLTNLDMEYRSVMAYVDSLPPEVKRPPVEFEDGALGDYRPAPTLPKIVFKINKYVKNGLDLNKLTAKQKKDCLCLIGYIHSYRFLHQINTYTTQTDRDLFESVFVRYTYDKSDLTEEECDLNLILATESVIDASIQRTITALQRQIDEEVAAGNRLPMPLIEAITSARTERNQCVARQQKLNSDLKMKRSERIEGQKKEYASILNLVGIWKNEEQRNEMLELANKRRELLKGEINRLSTMDDIKARIFGISENEVLNG